MFLGFFAWYRGLELGGVAKISQVQLAQPLLTVAASVLLFGQRLEPVVLVAAGAVLVCVAAAQRTRVRPAAVGRAVPRPRDLLPPSAADTPASCSAAARRSRGRIAQVLRRRCSRRAAPAGDEAHRA
jgi:hypothetical protein